MSGIVGFINLDREPADPEILQKVCRPLRDRAPDDSNTWQRGCVGLGHALLAISPDEAITSQPCTLDGNVWVTSDAHLYGKDELVKKLLSAGIREVNDATVPELLLLAYRHFGEAFAQHLVGDFAIAIWDERHEKLICARDHLGVRPLFYAHTDEVFIFGSDIDALLEHPAVSEELNDAYIADFLLFGVSIEDDATAYKHIKRLPAAHYLTVDATGIRIHQYWSAPLHQLIRYSQASEYTEHFASLFEKAVIERLPSTQVALQLSGGMDSGSIAAVTATHAGEYGQKIMAFTNTCHELIPGDQEGHYASMIADYLGIPLQLLACEDYPLFDRFDSPVLHTAEPFCDPGLAQHYDKLKRMGDAGCRVLLTGQMGDTLFAGSVTYFPHLAKTGNLVRLVTDTYAHRKNIGSLTGTGLGAAIKGNVRKLRRKEPWRPDLPGWLTPEFAERVDLKNRWLAIWKMWSEMNDAYGQLQRPWFSTIFEVYEAVRLPYVVRHPFSDLRLVEFMLRVPNYMHHNKRVLREAMQTRLPAEIISRPKAALPGDLLRAKMETGLYGAEVSLKATEAFIDITCHASAYQQFASKYGVNTTWSAWLINNPIALAHWMNNNKRILNGE